jgi:hypothetical protein
MKRRLWIVPPLGLALLAVALAAALIDSGQGEAIGTPQVLPVAKADLTPALKRGVTDAAREAGIDPASIVEVDGFGSGKYRRGVFVGTDRSGGPQVSLSHGFGFVPFAPPGRLFAGGDSMLITEGFSGPSTEVRSVGLVGVVKPGVSRVTIERRDGTSADAEFASSAPTGNLRFFATYTELPSTFPVVVRAYSASGKVIQEYRSAARALCNQSNPRCLN